MAGFTLVRARNELGQFIADDPATPENEAWVQAPVEDNDTNGGGSA